MQAWGQTSERWGRGRYSGRLSEFVARGHLGDLWVVDLGVLAILVRFRDDDVSESASTTPGRRGGGARIMPNASLRTVSPVVF